MIEINNLAIEAIEIDHDTSLTKFSSPEYGVHAYIIGPTFVNTAIGRRATYMVNATDESGILTYLGLFIQEFSVLIA